MGKCGCIPNMVPGEDAPRKVCACQTFTLKDCVAANIQSAQAAKAAAQAASGVVKAADAPPRCVPVPKGAVRQVPCVDETTSTGSATAPVTPATAAVTTPAAGATAPKTAAAGAAVATADDAKP